LKKNLTDAGVQLGFARVPWNTRADFDRHHLTEAIGSAWIFNRLHDALDAFEALASKNPVLSIAAAKPSATS